MKKLITFIFFLCAVQYAGAQKFLDNLQRSEQGKGSITVTQSKEITNLVNGNPVAETSKATTSTATKPTHEAKSKNAETAEAKSREVAPNASKPSETKMAEEKRNDLTERKTTTDDAIETPVVDTRKKVMRHSYKVTGYRVQVFSGGNTRADRIQAENIGGKLKASFPDQPIYVHFYSPRWICRMGNFRSYYEAQTVLKRVKAMGYKSACIVKGKITVQN